jgi:antitoxin component HigA of HigAB toxin-antitoxin module
MKHSNARKPLANWLEVTKVATWKTFTELLGSLIAEYEKKLPSLAARMTAQEALRYLMETNSLTQSDLDDCVGHKSNLSAFLNGHRGLSKRAACRLAEYFKISPEWFLITE